MLRYHVLLPVVRFGAAIQKTKVKKTRMKKEEVEKKLVNQNWQQMKETINLKGRVMKRTQGNKNQRGKKSMKWMIQMRMMIR